MSRAFVKEGDADQLKDVAANWLRCSSF